MVHKFSLYLVLSWLLLMSACAVRGPVDGGVRLVEWERHQAALLALKDWGFDGRVVIDDGGDSVRMALRWSQQSRQFDIRLMSFFGQQQARLQGLIDGAVSLSRPNKVVQQADNVVSLMQRELGWDLPVDGLRFWVLGTLVPDVEGDWTIDSQGRLEWLEQNGWRVEFAAYQRVAGLSMPRKIRLYHEGLRARLVLDQWQIDQSSGAAALVMDNLAYTS